MSTENQAGQIVFYDPLKVMPFENQPRKRFRGIPALARSIKQDGQVTPCVVTLLPEHPQYLVKLVDGERRLRACILGNMLVRCEIQEHCDDKKRYAKSVAANFNQQGHDCVEIAQAAKELLGDDHSEESYQRVATTFGKHPNWVRQHLNILRLDPRVQEFLQTPADPEDGKHVRGVKRKSKLTFSTGLQLLPLPPDEQYAVARHIVDKKLSMNATRRYLAQLEGKEGQRVGMRSIGPREKFNRLAGQVNSCNDAFGTFLDLSDDEFQRVIMSVGPLERGELLEKLEECAQGMLGLATAIRRATEQQKQRQAKRVPA